ncbi:type I-B CRISPR-associated protein Cas5 [Thermoanaerobacterium thermosaccharolyticum]|uniref:Type I-B CRISPR-associated protein Cas5 n=1 Tax=Thermoanaerobacterium thermosaccharolyticum TaxID=1517 RepID=A0A231VKW2_THETR|nr:type I-B CRISPR-associated protein Cas5b [Thermoanaerobacterium thermosaccharolyticum]OXT08893.1 type I-B CRISPR-associated protein Cas5 [Thermoanaerobacterium thermosaccharolyticum]
MYNIDRLILFDIKGPMAHFRKYYTNSSSLSYAFPPRTAIMGIIAGMLGYERDSYYDLLSSKNCHIGISIINSIRSIYKTVNYISVISKNDVNGINGHTQIPLEIIVPNDLKINNLCYRIYFWHQNKEVMDDIEKRLAEKDFVYPIYLGLTEFIANVSNYHVFNKGEIREKTSKDYVKISSVCNLDNVEEFGLSFKTENTNLQYVKEIMPLDFTKERESMISAYFLYEKNQGFQNIKLKSPYIELEYKGNIENITFMEA